MLCYQRGMKMAALNLSSRSRTTKIGQKLCRSLCSQRSPVTRRGHSFSQTFIHSA